MSRSVYSSHHIRGLVPEPSVQCYQIDVPGMDMRTPYNTLNGS